MDFHEEGNVTPTQTIARKEVDVVDDTSKRGEKERLLQNYKRRNRDSRKSRSVEIPVG